MFPFGKIISGIPWASAKPITIGTSTVPQTLAASEHAMDIYTTSADATATVNSFQLKSTTTGFKSEDQTMYVHAFTNVYSGDENTVGHFYSEWGTAPGIGPLGMASAVTGKMLLPTNCTGAFYAFYGKMNMPTTPGLQTAGAGGNAAGWFMLSIGGAGLADFSNNGVFMDIHNLTAGADKLLSLHSQTLKSVIDVSTLRYMVLSQMQDGLGLGLSNDKMVLTDGLHAIDIHCSTALTGNSERSIPVEINLTRGATGGSGTCRDWGLKVNLTSTHKYPSGANAIYGAITFVTAGVHGRGAALQGEIIMPNGQLTRGAFSCLHLDMTCGANTNVGSSGPLSFISLNMETSPTEMDRGGYLFEIQGLTEGDGKLIDSTGGDLAVEGGIRCVFGTTPFWLLYTTTEPA